MLFALRRPTKETDCTLVRIRQKRSHSEFGSGQNGSVQIVSIRKEGVPRLERVVHLKKLYCAHNEFGVIIGSFSKSFDLFKEDALKLSSMIDLFLFETLFEAI